MIHLKIQLGDNQPVRLCALEPIADAKVVGLPCGGSCIKIPVHIVPGAADVIKLTSRHQYTCSCRPTCLQLPGECCTVIHRHVKQVSIVERIVTFHRLLPVFRVVRCSSAHSFQARITVELFRCYCAMCKSYFPKVIILPRSNYRSFIWSYVLAHLKGRF